MDSGVGRILSCEEESLEAGVKRNDTYIKNCIISIGRSLSIVANDTKCRIIREPNIDPSFVWWTITHDGEKICTLYFNVNGKYRPGFIHVVKYKKKSEEFEAMFWTVWNRMMEGRA